MWEQKMLPTLLLRFFLSLSALSGVFEYTTELEEGEGMSIATMIQISTLLKSLVDG